jgi:hypothetical protein
MSMSITKYFLSPVRHPEQSEAESILFPIRLRPSLVEGPRRSYRRAFVKVCALFAQGHSRRLWGIKPHSDSRSARLGPRRSFDFGSITRNAQTNLPLAFAQDDGALVFGDFAKLSESVVAPQPDVEAARLPLVPKLHLGTSLSPQLRCPGDEAELRRQARSQVQLGNEESVGTRVPSRPTYATDGRGLPSLPTIRP